MSENFVPVNPARDDQGRLIALKPIVGEDQAAPTLLDSFDPKNPHTHVQLYTGTLEGNARANYGSVFSASGGYVARAFTQKFYYGRQVFADAGPAIAATFWGVGFNVNMRAVSVEAEADVSFAALAASAEVGHSQVQYEVQGVGFGIDVFAKFLAAVPVSGSLDARAYAGLIGVHADIIKTLPKVTAKDLVPLGVIFRDAAPGGTVISEAAAVRQAMLQITYERPLSEALKNLPANVDEAVVTGVYNTYVANPESISATDVSNAQTWLMR